MSDTFKSMAMPFNPKDWWWHRASDNDLYSSKLQKKMALSEAEKNPDFIAFRKNGGRISDWPYDIQGVQTDHELERTLKVLYGLEMYPPSLDEIKASQIKIIKKATGEAIITGFLAKINGKSYLFPYEETDQLNFNSQMGIIQAGMWSQISWRCYHCTNGVVDKSRPEQIRLEKQESFIALYQAANRHRTEMLAWSWSLQEKIQKAKSEKTIRAVVWSYPPSLEKFVIG